MGEFFHPNPVLAYPQEKVLRLYRGGLLVHHFDVKSFKFTR